MTMHTFSLTSSPARPVRPCHSPGRCCSRCLLAASRAPSLCGARPCLQHQLHALRPHGWGSAEHCKGYQRQAARPSRRLITVRASATDTSTLSLELNTEEARASLKFGESRNGKAKLIVVSYVAPGSTADQEGLRPGQQLLEISDPIRYTEMWQLNDRPSLRFVRDALSMRRGDTISLTVSTAPVVLPEFAARLCGPDDAINIATAMPADLQEDSDDEACLSPTLTIAEKLEAQYASAEDYDYGRMSSLERRLKRRKERAQAEAQRDDGPFFLAVAAAFLLPALVILAVAVSTGYLDTLSRGY